MLSFGFNSFDVIPKLAKEKPVLHFQRFRDASPLKPSVLYLGKGLSLFSLGGPLRIAGPSPTQEERELLHNPPSGPPRRS